MLGREGKQRRLFVEKHLMNFISAELAPGVFVKPGALLCYKLSFPIRTLGDDAKSGGDPRVLRTAKSGMTHSYRLRVSRASLETNSNACLNWTFKFATI